MAGERKHPLHSVMLLLEHYVQFCEETGSGEQQRGGGGGGPEGSSSNEHHHKQLRKYKGKNSQQQHGGGNGGGGGGADDDPNSVEKDRLKELHNNLLKSTRLLQDVCRHHYFGDGPGPSMTGASRAPPAAPSAAAAAGSSCSSGDGQDVNVDVADAMMETEDGEFDEAGLEGSIPAPPAAIAPNSPAAMGVSNPLCDVIDRCDFHMLGLAVTHVLAVQAEVMPSVDDFMDRAKKLMLRYNDEHIRVCPKLFYTVCAAFADESIRRGEAIQAILPLRTAADSFAPSEVCLTAIHADLIHCCIQAKCYHIAVQIMDAQPMLEIRPRSTGLTPVNFLRYFYYGGVCYVGMKKWRKAMLYFQMVVAAPCTNLSSIMVEAYKKMTLVSLIHEGQPPDLQSYHASQVALRSLKVVTPTYAEFADRFKQGDMAALQQAADAAKEEVRRDGNGGLMKQAVAALTRKKISQLTHTYITLSLQDIATSVGLPSAQEAEKRLLQMIEVGEIGASIEHPSETVLFKEDVSQYASVNMLRRMEDDLSAMKVLAERLRVFDEEVTTSKEYVRKTTTEEGMAASSGELMEGIQEVAAYRNINMYARGYEFDDSYNC